MTTKNIKINVDTKDAVKETDKLTNSFDNLEKETGKTSNSLKDVGDNGGAIAILDSLTGGLATQMRDAFEATKLFNFSLKGTSKALIATGVGAFVVALGSVVAYWDEISDFVNGVNNSLEKQQGIIKSNITSLDLKLELLKAEEKSLIAQGKSTADILVDQKELIEDKKKQLDADIEIQASLVEQNKSNIKNITFTEKAYIVLLKTLGLHRRAAIAIAESVAGTEEETKALTEQEDALISIRTQRALLDVESKDIDGKIAGPSVDPVREKETSFELTNGLTFEDNITLESKELLNEKLSELDQKYGEDIIQRANNELLADEERARQRIILENQVKDAKVGIAQNTLALVGALANEGTALAKAAAVAQATISGFQGAQNAFTTASASPITTLFPAYPFIQAGLAGAFSAVQIGNILKTPNNGSGQPPSGNTGRGGGGAPQAPSFKLVQGTQGNQIANSLNSQAPIQAFVVGTAVTSQQSLDRNAESNGTL
jgi:hypothetical protein